MIYFNEGTLGVYLRFMFAAERFLLEVKRKSLTWNEVEDLFFKNGFFASKLSIIDGDIKWK